MPCSVRKTIDMTNIRALPVISLLDVMLRNALMQLTPRLQWKLHYSQQTY
jgi:hypothetical protein